MRPSQVKPWTVWVIAINIMGAAALAWLLYSIRSFLMVLVVALVLTMAVNPVVEWLQRHRFKRGWAIFTVLAFFIVASALLVLSFIPIFTTQGQNLVEALPEMFKKFQNWGPVVWAQQQFDFISRTESVVQSHGTVVAKSAWGAASTFLAGVFGLGTALILSVFMLIFGKDVIETFLDFIGPRQRAMYEPIFDRIRTTVGRYVLGLVFVACIGAIVITLSLMIMGVPYFLPLGLLMILAGLVPYLGPAVAAFLIVSVTLATSGWVKALVMAGIFGMYQIAEGNLLQPVVQRRAIQLNPLIVVIALLAGASLGGVLGAILALPVAGTIKAVVEDARSRRKDLE